MTRRGTFQKLRPLSLLEHLSSCYDSAHLQVFSNSVCWSVYIEQGKITYASHSVDPFERLERHLRHLDNLNHIIDNETIAQLRLIFTNDSLTQLNYNCDYEAIGWLVNHQYLDRTQATILIEKLVKEVIESFLLVREGSYELGYRVDVVPEFCRLDLKPIVDYCQKQLQGWQSLGPQIWSPYQRPYFLMQNKDQQEILVELQQKFSGMLKGFSFRHLAVLLNQDDLQLAQSLHPHIVNENVFLYEPIPPFDRLPKTCDPTKTFEQFSNPLEQVRNPFELSQIPSEAPQSVETPKEQIRNSATSQSLENPTYPSQPIETLQTLSSLNTAGGTNSVLPGMQNSPGAKRKYKVVCVDDSTTILQEISHFLDDESFSVIAISDPVKALMQIILQKPDLILLDVKMENIDGYELCRLLRNHSLFKNTPIIMVTGNTGIIDRVKARVVGASGYLTKPFTKAGLLKIMFKYLS